MAYAVVQSKAANAAGAATVAATFTSTTTTGNAIIVVVSSWNLAVSGVADNKSNAYTLIGTGVNGTSERGTMYYCANATGGATHTVTATISAAADCAISVHEVSGLATSTLLDNYGTGSANASVTVNLTTSTPAASTTNANDMVVVGIGTDNGGTNAGVGITTGYTSEANGYISSTANIGVIMAHKRVTATGTQTAGGTTGGGANGWGGVIATFKESGGGGAVAPLQYVYVPRYRN